MPNSRPRRRSPDDKVGGANNKLRVDLYRRLIGLIQTQDQASGAQGYVLHWNDPEAQWNKVDDIRAAWNSVGLSPIIQTLFFVLETMAGEELEILESLDGIIDPITAPEELLSDIAASFGYRLKEDLDVETKRVVTQGLFVAYKALGQRIAFDVFYRMVGFSIIKVYPLWKKAVNEDLNRYARAPLVTTPITAETIGPAGSTTYATTLSDGPIAPGSLRITDGTVILKDQPEGFVADGLVVSRVVPIVGPGVETGTIDYQTNKLVVTFSAPTTGPVTADYRQITDDYPYRAARMDIEILMNPGGLPIPLVDSTVLRSVLDRLDEARPIHVLLRALTLAFEIDDEVQGFATDVTACTSKLIDSRDPFGVLPGLEALFMLDVSPAVGEDNLFIDHASGGVQTKDVLIEDRMEGFVCPGMDLLDITAGAFSQKV